MIPRTQPFLCIVPPHLLREIAERGTATQRERALSNLTVSGQFRGERQEFGESVAALLAPEAAAEKQRTVYDAENKTGLPGRKVRGEGDPPTGDPAADEAYDGAGETYNLYQDIYERNSIDNRGLPIDSTVHYGVSYDNAFWNGRQMAYGDGDEDLPEEERIFNRFTIAIDIIGHELAHGVTQYEAGLVYRNQPGALNESFSDVFGSLVKQRQRNQSADEADWLVGAGLFTANVNAQGLRSMKAPGTAYDDPLLGKDPQPAHMRDYRDVIRDNGGVHINSGIPNRAFYLVARELGGFAWEKAGRIWYVTLRDKLEPRSDFQDAANLTFQVSRDLFGSGSLEQQAVRAGWAGVGINVGETDKKGCLQAPVSAVRSALRPSS